MIKRPRRRHIVGLSVLGAVGLLACKCVWFPGRAFDAIAWHDEVQVRNGVRLGMADRLIADRALLGTLRSEVVGLLGEPPATGYFSDWDLVYWLGPERAWMSIDSEWLVLRLSPDGRVVDARIVRD